MPRARIIARGMVFVGFFTSSLMMVILPNPVYAKNMRAAPCITPIPPFGMKGEKLAAFTALIPKATKKARMRSFTVTRKLLTRLESFAPR